MLFFLSDPESSLHALMSKFREYGDLSHLSINYSKSVALNLGTPEIVLRRLRLRFPFQWSTSKVKYLGIFLSAQTSDLFKFNFLPLLLDIKRDLTSWRSISFSWLGRAAMLKMNILPRLLYLFQAIPIRLPKVYLKQLTKEFRLFVWMDKSPRLSWTLLTAPKAKGGLDIPDVQDYYSACHLTRIIDWHIHDTSKMWVALEKQWQPRALTSVAWLESRLWPPSLRSHPLIGASLVELSRLRGRNFLTTPQGPLTPLTDNPDFPAGQMTDFTSHWSSSTLLIAQTFFKNQLFLERGDLSSLARSECIPWWTYLQVRHFLNDPKKRPSYSRPLTPFELACTGRGPSRHLISWLYAHLRECRFPLSSLRKHRWEKDLGFTLDDEVWEEVCTVAHSSSMSSKTQETNFKILSRWYRTPEKLHKIDQTCSETCWRCNSGIGSMIHVFWECPIIESFWRQVHDTIQQIIGMSLEFSPALFLLHLREGGDVDPAKSLLKHLINAARSLIPKLWRDTRPPTISEWLRQISFVFEMEELLHTKQDKLDRFSAMWAPWQLYLTNQTRSTQS